MTQGTALIDIAMRLSYSTRHLRLGAKIQA
jgi:hypothetical protein